ncbi:alkaline phosphatase family protein [Idiomarina aminovorans]|uniref:alkaline phosphatase family protein n=1 Tax=Idiomarina aminovorans TaxID=2914829 RepID=UPI002005275B|nr:ectonucleotide pyrophosphatase/phosphodiesterase [Idiomarina sp. ATCH4]MCK7459764.1 ectonucleotide pyrophosphatase/phosphodiesterase [Idiomarina sp. ATCH4]
MKILLAVCLVVFSSFTFGKSNEQTVVLISIDGFRHDYIEKHDAKNIAKLAEQGVRSEGLIPVYPSKTFPNHLSIITGRYPTNHGLVDNNFYDTERQQKYSMGDGLEDSSWITALPLWNLAEFQGVKAATFFWPESDARINGRTPSYFYHYSTPVPNRQRVDQIIEWLQLPEQARPRLVTGYFSVVDSMGHRFGPDSKQVKGAVKHVDELIGELWQRLQTEVDPSVNLVLVSDHGMAPILADKMMEVDELSIDDNLFTVINAQTRLLIYANQGTSEQQVKSLRTRLTEMTNMAFHVESEKQLAKRHFTDGPRVPAIVLGTKAPDTFATRPAEQRSDGGTHGYYGTREMDGFFVATGPALDNNKKIERFENIHIYPMLAGLLGLELLTEIDGRADVLQPILETD